MDNVLKSMGIQGNNEIDRRAFLKRFGATLAGITIIGSLPAILESCSNNAVDVGAGADAGHTMTVDVSALTANNTAIHTTAPASGRPLLIVRRSATAYETLLLVCPHQGCSYPNVDLQGSSITCSCHNSVFDLNGGRVSGPTPSGLTSFITTYDASTKKVTVTF